MLRGVEGPIDGLGGNGRTVIVEDCSRNLLQTPMLVEVALNDLAKLDVNLESA